MKTQLMALFSLLFSTTVYAQKALKGCVTDSATHEKLVGVSVTVLRHGKPISFIRTDEMGVFELSVASFQPTDSLRFTYLGYRRSTMAVGARHRVDVQLVPEAFTLREVHVKGSRVFAAQDTITYDLTRFVNERDNSLKDVLRKLPGVEVGEGGQVLYNGKAVNRFTVEGLDLTGGRYNQLEEKIQAKDVKKAEIIEHDQPIKALRDKVFADQVAMNIGLKEEARDRLMPTLKPYLLIGSPTHLGGEVNLMQIGKKRQLMYDVAFDRTGQDLSKIMSQLSRYGNQLDALDMPSWISMPALQTPIDAERLRFNTSQKYGINRIQKHGDDNELRLSANFMHALERQQTSNSSVYNFGSGTPVATQEDSRLRLKTDDFEAEVEHKVNSDRYYGNETLQITAQQHDALSDLGDTLRQRMRIPELNVVGNLYRLYTLKGSQLSWRSVVDYHHAVSDLYINASRTRFRNNLWHTAHALGWTRKRRYFTQQYTMGLEADNLNIVSDNVRYGFQLTPYWQYERGKTLVSFSPQLKWQHFVRQHQSLLLLQPSCYVTRKVAHHSEWTVIGNYSEQAGGMSQYMLDNYRQDYRSWFTGLDFVPKERNLYSTVEYHYKRPIRELFITAALMGNWSWSDVMPDLQIVDGNYYTRLVERPSRQRFWRASAAVAKGFYALHLKTRLSGSYSRSQGEQLSGDRAVPYRQQSYRLSPHVEYASAWGAVSYQSDFSWNRSQTQAALFCWKQSLSLTSTIGPVDISWAMVHYRNQIDDAHHLNLFLADAGMVWRMKKVRLSAQLRNLFDRHRYEQTRYTGVGVFTDAHTLRGRELILSAQLVF